VQGAAISQKSSVQCAVLFKVVPLAFLLLITALLLTQEFFYLS
jgi:positive regulator of sigma E activity